MGAIAVAALIERVAAVEKCLLNLQLHLLLVSKLALTTSC
jgi:hypothetical protein